MKLSKRQQEEKENLEWFCGDILKQWPPQEGEFEEYLAHSERGKPMIGFPRGYNKFNVWAEAKRRRGITVHELWEKDWEGGNWLGWENLLQEEDGRPIPEHVKDFIAREIFAGKNKDVIDECYKAVCNNYGNRWAQKEVLK